MIAVIVDEVIVPEIEDGEVAKEMIVEIGMIAKIEIAVIVIVAEIVMNLLVMIEEMIATTIGTEIEIAGIVVIAVIVAVNDLEAVQNHVIVMKSPLINVIMTMVPRHLHHRRRHQTVDQVWI